MATASREHPEDATGPNADDRPSTFGLLRNVVLDMTQVVEDSTELIGASVREELAQFRVDMTRSVLSLVAIIIGGSLLTAGLALVLHGLIGSWSATLLIFGAIYLAFALGLHMAGRSDDAGGR